MAHGISRFDAGLVGMCEEFGGTWHRLPKYKQLNGEVPLEEVRKTLQYEVVKVPLAFDIHAMKRFIPNPVMEKIHGQTVILPDLSEAGGSSFAGGKMYAMVRTDFGVPVHTQSVSDDYEIFTNEQFLNNIEKQLLNVYPELKIESCGSLWAGRVSFVNIMIKKYTVKKDCSDTVARLMFWNAFGGKSIAGCENNTRVVCNNTSMHAEAQGEINKTLRKFKHTSGAPIRVVQHLVDLAKINALVMEHNAIMDKLADLPMNSKEVDDFLGCIFPIPKEAGAATVTRRTNNRNKVRSLFEGTPDLQGQIARTRYAMYQATTAYSQHHTTNAEADETYTWWDVATGGGRHTLNQLALDTLVKPVIPESSELVPV